MNEGVGLSQHVDGLELSEWGWSYHRESEAFDVAAEGAEVRGQELRKHVDPFLLRCFGRGVYGFSNEYGTYETVTARFLGSGRQVPPATRLGSRARPASPGYELSFRRGAPRPQTLGYEGEGDQDHGVIEPCCSEEGSYLRLIDFCITRTLVSIVIKKKKKLLRSF